MKFPETQALLTIISGIDRRQFPDGAAVAWYEILRETDFQDAKMAVLEYFSGGSDSVPTLLPGRVRTGAQRFRTIRERADQPAIEAAPPVPAAQARSAAFLKAREEIRLATAAAEAKLRAEDPTRAPYRHRQTLLTQVG
jgi:hypothetical protein